jgi:triacylglycerol lipase
MASEAGRWWGRPVAEMRWQAELVRLCCDPLFLRGGEPRGDGRPVVLVPGFGAGDWTLAHLAFWLGRTGYDAVTCNFLVNAGCAEKALAPASSTRRRPRLAAVAVARAVQGRRGCLTEERACGFSAAYACAFPPDVRLTSIYSRGDGMVRWESCMADYADNVEVTGSHVGLAWNRKSYRAIAVALAEPENVRGSRSD